MPIKHLQLEEGHGYGGIDERSFRISNDQLIGIADEIRRLVDVDDRDVDDRVREYGLKIGTVGGDFEDDDWRSLAADLFDY